MTVSNVTPKGDVSIRALAMPADTNPSGDIFGGWLLSQMDLAGGTAARFRTRGRVATVAIEGMTFHKPVLVGDELTCYTNLLKIGRTSLTYRVEAWVRRKDSDQHVKVTEGIFTFVAMDENRQPRVVPPE